MTEKFTQTSSVPYNRHRYKLVYTNQKYIIYEDYEEARLAWFQTPSQLLSHIEVLDKTTKSKGFK
jgi:hypothetical protein